MIKFLLIIVDSIISFISRTFLINIAGVDIAPTYWQAGLIVLLVFMLVFTLARVRYLYVHWSLGKSSISFLFWGFVLAIIFEGFLLLSGRTIFTEILGWRSAPKPISTVLDIGRNKLVDVLGVQDEIPFSSKGEPQLFTDFINEYNYLTSEEKEALKSTICTPKLTE